MAINIIITSSYACLEDNPWMVDTVGYNVAFINVTISNKIAYTTTFLKTAYVLYVGHTIF